MKKKYIILFFFYLLSFSQIVSAEQKHTDIIIVSIRNSSIARQIKNELIHHSDYRIHFKELKSEKFDQESLLEEQLLNIKNQLFQFKESQAIISLKKIISEWTPRLSSIKDQKAYIKFHELLAYAYFFSRKKNEAKKSIHSILVKYPFHNLDQNYFPPSLIKFYERVKAQFLKNHKFLETTIKSNYSESKIYFNGVFMGMSPLKFKYIPAGFKHSLIARRQRKIGFKILESSEEKLEKDTFIIMNQSIRHDLDESLILDKVLLDQERLKVKKDKVYGIIIKKNNFRLLSAGFKKNLNEVIEFNNLRKKENWIDSKILKTIQTFQTKVMDEI